MSPPVTRCSCCLVMLRVCRGSYSFCPERPVAPITVTIKSLVCSKAGLTAIINMSSQIVRLWFNKH